MKLVIISPSGTQYNGETDFVSFPGMNGSFDILPHHAPMIAALQAGVVRFREEETDKIREQQIQSGFVEIKDDILSVCIE